MRRVILNTIFFGFLGFFSSFFGFPFTTYQFWVFIGLAAAIQINSLWED